MRPIYFSAVLLSAFFILCGSALAAGPSKSTQGFFTSVSGKVEVTSKSGKNRPAQKDSTVVEGERIVTGKDSNATLQLFDGSQLEISPNTDLALKKMQKPSAKDKVLQFKLFVGSLLSRVKKLASSRSSFEIEAGGVVCGVRGTQYHYSYDPKAHNVTVHVDEGTVYINTNGHTYLFTAGQTGIFTNGLPAVQHNGQSSKPIPSGANPAGASSLADLNEQFGNGLAINGDNNFTNPSVAGSLHLNIHLNVSPPETLP